MSNELHQKTGDFNALMRDAQHAQRKLNRLLRAASTRYNGIGVYPGVKQAARAAEKVKEDYAGDASRLIDLARGSIVVMSLEEVDEVRDFFDRHGKIVREKNRFDKPLAHGHRDLTLNVELDNGHICEVQIHLLEMFAFKRETHALYKKLRRVQDDAENHGISPEKVAEKSAMLTEQIRQMNEEAARLFNDRTTGRKLAPLAGPDLPSLDRRHQVAHAKPVSRMPRLTLGGKQRIAPPAPGARRYKPIVKRPVI